MERDEQRQPHYVRKVQEDTRRYIQTLLSENETLRTLLAKFESEKLRLEEQFLTLQQQLDSHRREQLRLQRQLAEIEADNQRFAKGYADIEQHNSNLANLYVASYRLHATLDREEVLGIVQEIIVNLVGSEEIGIFELEEERSVLRLVASYGIEETRYARIPVGSGTIGCVVETGKPYFRESGDDGPDREDEPTACIALHVNGQITGAVAIFRLLPQKTGLESLDHELLDLLATHAATALYAAELHSRFMAEMRPTR